MCVIQNNDEKMVLVTVHFDVRNLGIYDPVPEREVTETCLDIACVIILDASQTEDS